jgi:hypothetical protein
MHHHQSLRARGNRPSLLITSPALRTRSPRAYQGKNSPSRWRFRPPPPQTFGLRLWPSGTASVY